MLGFFNYTTWLTYLGAACGVAGIWCAAAGHLTMAVLLLSIAGLIDSFDGKVASTKKDRTDEMKKFGIQIDSLSDLICFGVLPSALLFGFAKAAFPALSALVFLPIACAFVLCALIRLAYFNVAEEIRQKTEGGKRMSYTGIPVTMVSIFLPLFYGLSELLKFFLRNVVSPDAWMKGYFIFFCVELCFFAFAFLFKGFRVAKLHGKKMIMPVVVGTVGFIGVIAAFFINS